MLPTTIDAVKALLRADPTVTPADRMAIIAIIRNHGKSVVTKPTGPVEKRIMRRDEVARRFAMSLRSVDKMATDGILRRVRLPGRRRACGFVADEVERLITSEGQE